MSFSIGNFIPKYENPAGNGPCTAGNTSASFELACVHNNANTVAIVGHSNCKVSLLCQNHKLSIPYIRL